ncbi:MAG: ThiF family adenylyltransferase [Phycisphaerales bacterium]|nr:ThiF family adenylyltransferase [Phycisphaerales bacterium]
MMDITSPQKTVFISDEQLKMSEEGMLYGRYYKGSGIFNVFPAEMRRDGDPLGKILAKGSAPNKSQLCGVITDTGIEFYSYGKKISCEAYSLYQKIFSRNSGILESDVMKNKRAVICGCGSVGSLVALELARAGVGHFVLADADILEYHNVCRHQCGIEDVGNLKVHSLRRKILNINPRASVTSFEGIIQNLPKNTLDSFCQAGDTIFVGCADNRIADIYTNRISIYYQASFISIGFWERAFAGEIFYHMPGKGMPCYECALGDGGTISARAEANHHVYSNQEITETTKFEPGISVDINFVTTIGIKLILDILNAGHEGYIPRLLGRLTQYTLACNTSDPQIGGEMVEIFSYPLQVTTSLKVGFSKKCGKKCKYEK